MPRKAREKNPEMIYHIMCRSVSEFLLFRDDEDKLYYLNLLKRYTEKYKCRLYAYCLMDNHLHLHLDPGGFDISKFMHSLSVAYVVYYNKKYRRHGHVFQERFESRILDTDQYNLAVSAYIHNNPKDMEDYQGKEEQYPYSSYGIYLGIRKDTLKLIDKNVIKSLFNIKEDKFFAIKYREYATHQRDVGGKSLNKLGRAIENKYISGRRIILRELKPAKIISYISNKLMIKAQALADKATVRAKEFRAFTAYVMRVLCGLSYREICQNINNITVSGCSSLCNKGYELMKSSNLFKRIFEDLISQGVN